METAKLLTPAILLMTLAFPPAAGAHWFGGSSFVPGSRISRDGNNRPCHVPAGPCFPGPSVSVHVGKPPRADKPAGLRLKVAPADARVYVDGKYAGAASQFDGNYESLELKAGRHLVEIHAPGYVSIETEVVAREGRTTEYRAALPRVDEQ